MQQTVERLTSGIKAEREFIALERERLATDQITEASERLNGAMENVFEYTLEDNNLYFQGQSLRPIFEAGIRAAEEIVKTRPEFMVELTRRYREFSQLGEQIELRRNVDWQNPLVLVHISPTPDAVLKDEVNLNAYDKKRKKIMVRITEPTADGVQVTSLSLDCGDSAALRSVGDFFGVDIPDAASSEDILDMRFLAEKSQFNGERPAKVLRERYDKAMKMQYGGEWYAGRRDSNVLDTMQRILAYPELIEQHVNEIWALKKRLGKNFRFTKEYENATYNFLAAIEQADKLGKVVGSIGDAGDLARAAGVEFAKSDCPTGVALSAEKALEMQAIGERRWMSCGVCDKRDACYGDPCNLEGVECRFCHSYIRNGKVVDMRGKFVKQDTATKQVTEVSQRKTMETASESTRDFDAEFEMMIEQQFGKGAVVEERIEVGGTRLDVKQHGEVVMTGLKLAQYALNRTN